MINYSPWEEIKALEYKVPFGQTVAELTPELLAALGSTDGHLRDDLALEILCTWMHQGHYHASELRDIARQLQNNLLIGLGKPEDDSVFLRSFSALVLSQMILVDIGRPFLGIDEWIRILTAALGYFAAEADWRGHDEDKGWAHALAHTADLFSAFTKHPRTGEQELKQILQSIGNKVREVHPFPLLYEEDERLAKAVTRVLRRELLSAEFLREWLMGIAMPQEDQTWRILVRTGAGAAAYHNAKGFLRSLYFQCQFLDVPGWKQLTKDIEEALKQLDIYIYKNK